MLFNADIRENFALKEVKQKQFIQKVKNVELKFTIILDKINLPSNNWAQG